MNRKEGAIISAYTGLLLGEFGELQMYIDKLYKRKNSPIKSKIYSKEWGEEVKKASEKDFMKIHNSLKWK